MSNEISRKQYDILIDEIDTLFESGREKAFQAANKALINTYWNIGRRIVEFEQCGKDKAEYGSRLFRTPKSPQVQIDFKNEQRW